MVRRVSIDRQNSPLVKAFTPKQRAFVDAYLQLGNATAAARNAGYNANYASLRVIASQNLKKPHIRDFINRVNGAFLNKAQQMMMEKLPV